VTGKRISAPRLIIVMGVSAAGKTVVGRALAAALSWRFLDADEFHSAANKAKMHRGEGLTDADRAPWLAKLRDVNSAIVAQGPPTVLACSALKQAYRDELVPIKSAPGAVQFVYLDVPVEVLRQRLASRQHHFAPPELLDSQLATLEKPRGALWVDGTKPIDEIVRSVRDALTI
jgi:gluconokinase